MTRVRVPFSVGDLGVCKEGFGRVSESPDEFRDEFIRRGLMFSLTWQDLRVTVAHCCTLDEKQRVRKKAEEHTDSLLATDPHHQIYQAGGDAFPDHDSRWGYEDHVGQDRMRHYITCLSEGMKRHMGKPVNYEKVQEVTREKRRKLDGLPELGDRGI